MYGIRSMTNHYGMYAGGRGDLLITGHPEYQRGKIGTENGLPPGWVSGGPMKKALSVPTMQMQASMKKRGLPIHAGALKKSSFLTSVPLGGSFSSTLGSDPGRLVGTPSSSGHGVDDLDRFISKLRAPASMPEYSRESSVSKVTKYYQEVRNQLAHLRLKAMNDPKGLRSELGKSDTWRFHADALDELGLRRIWGEGLVDGGLPSPQAGTDLLVGRLQYRVPDHAMPHIMKPTHLGKPPGATGAKYNH
eukprot:TRINITY_DN13907_c0_g1_i1.p1 TRINITY_DN13907_c0_g1~~TRINITY_DN13907_c0_g1_i1.p1  ORF type:complete len:248 (+),score=35.21 TRINITY_DN13907_c0_g1_i1:164-907(+)